MTSVRLGEWLAKRRKALVVFVVNVLGGLAANGLLAGSALKASNVIIGLATLYGVHQVSNAP